MTTRNAWLFSFYLENMNLSWLASHSQIQWGGCPSPQNFSACTEKVCDMANKDLKDNDAVNLAHITSHQLDMVSESSPAVEKLI